MGSPLSFGGGVDNGTMTHELQRKVGTVAQIQAKLPDFKEAAITTGNTVVISAAYTRYTAGATVDAQTINLPASAADGQEVAIVTSQIITAATFGVASPGTATIVGAPTATAVNTPVRFRYIASQNKWYRL